MSSTSFDSDDMSVDVLLKDFYEVPVYQREYVWESQHVERLLTDIYNEFERGNGDPAEYFVGTIVTQYHEEKSFFELIAGQQRITTIYVILCAIRDLLAEAGQDTEGVSGQLRAVKYDRKGRGTNQYRVTLQYPDAQGVLKSLVQDRESAPIESIANGTRSARNLLNAYTEGRTFLLDSLQGSPDLIREFWAYLTQSVKVIRIKTASLTRALWIFETINQRGTGLNAMDLLKNLLFMNAKDEEFEILKNVWKALADTINDADESPMRFMRHFILADYARQKVQAEEIYGWITNEKNSDRPNYWDDPLGFARELLSAAQAYKNFSAGRLESGAPCRHLRNIWHCAHAARQHQILLLAARRAPEAAVARLAEEIEKLYFVFIVTHQSPNKFESDFVAWAGTLRHVTTMQGIEDFLEKYLIPRRHALAEPFEHAMRNLSEYNLPKYRLKYVLGRLAQHLNEIAYSDDADDPLQPYVATKVEVEHILSTAASEQDILEFGGTDEARARRHRLANLSLLEKPLNIVAGNKPFAEKLPEYAKSKFLLTSGMNTASRVGSDTSVNRALRWVNPYTAWTLAEFNDRENCLLALSQETWGVPPVQTPEQ